MSYDEIQHLDWSPGDRLDGLRERAAVAYQRAADVHKLALLQYAHEKVVDVLDEITTDGGIEVKVKNVLDGDGEVIFTIDGLRFRVNVVFPSQTVQKGSDWDGSPSGVSIAVQAAGSETWLSFPTVAALGHMIAEGRVEVAK